MESTPLNSSSTPSDPAEALEQVIEDEPIDLELLQWAEDELLKGRELAEVEAELIQQGWPAELAQRIVETARQQTREQRGIITRDDVVRNLNVDYRRATGGLSVAFRSGLFGLYGFTTGVMSAWRTLRKLSRGVHTAEVRKLKPEIRMNDQSPKSE